MPDNSELLSILKDMSPTNGRQLEGRHSEVGGVLDMIESRFLERITAEPHKETHVTKSITLEDLKQVLDGAKMNGNKLTAICPMHADSTPSFSASVGEKHDLVVHCFAGCRQDELLEHVLNLAGAYK